MATSDSTIPTKRCTICGNNFPATLEYFYPHKTCKYGIHSRCKTCHNNIMCAYRKTPIGKEKNRKTTAKQNADPEKRRRKYDKVKARYATDEAFRLRERKRSSEYQKIGGRQQVYVNRRRTRLKNLPSQFTFVDWQRCLNYWNHACCICGRPAGETHFIAQEHWIPISDPHPDNPGTVAWNIVPMCHGLSGCNNRKAKKNPITWLIEYLGETKADEKLGEIDKYFAWIRNGADE